MNIRIEVIDPALHRPGITGADWTFDDKGDLLVRVSKMSDWRFEMVLAIHEAVEAVMCKHNGVTQAMVDDFDIPYHNAHEIDLNAGDELDAPYRHEHCLATAIERIMAAELDVPWKTYDDEVATFR